MSRSDIRADRQTLHPITRSLASRSIDHPTDRPVSVLVLVRSVPPGPGPGPTPCRASRTAKTNISHSSRNGIRPLMMIYDKIACDKTIRRLWVGRPVAVAVPLEPAGRRKARWSPAGGPLWQAGAPLESARVPLEPARVRWSPASPSPRWRAPNV